MSDSMPSYQALVFAADSLEDEAREFVEIIRGPFDQQARLEALEKLEERFEKAKRLLQKYGEEGK